MPLFSPRQPWFYGWGFNLPRGQALLEKWNLIPEGVDILITHGPPLGKVCGLWFTWAGGLGGWGVWCLGLYPRSTRLDPAGSNLLGCHSYQANVPRAEGSTSQHCFCLVHLYCDLSGGFGSPIAPSRSHWLPAWACPSLLPLTCLPVPSLLFP